MCAELQLDNEDSVMFDGDNTDIVFAGYFGFHVASGQKNGHAWVVIVDYTSEERATLHVRYGGVSTNLRAVGGLEAFTEMARLLLEGMFKASSIVAKFGV